MIDSIDFFKAIDESLINDKRPSEFLNSLIEDKNFLEDEKFEKLVKLKKIPQSPKFHPEGNVWNHSMLVVDLAAQMKESAEKTREFMWVALLHDIGKGETTKTRKDKITAYDHDKVGSQLAITFLEQFTKDKHFIKHVSLLIKYHMHPLFINKKLPFADMNKMIKEVDIMELGLFSLCDRLGRAGLDEEMIEKEKQGVEEFMCRSNNFLLKDYQ